MATTGGANINYTMLDDLTVEQVAELPIPTLYEFQEQLDKDAKTLRQRNAKWKAALDSLYGEKAQAERVAKNKDSGRMNYTVGDLVVICDATKKVEYDQEKLSEIWSRISAGGDNPAAYIKMTLSVSETAFKDWPKNIQDVFTPARTVKTTASYEIKTKDK
jgi:hypothetical protein